MSTLPRLFTLRITVLITIGLLLATPCDAVQRIWIGGSGTWVDGAANNPFWTGSDEPDPDDQAIFNSLDTVTMGSNNEVQSVHASDGIDLDINGNALTVQNSIFIYDVGTNVIVKGTGAMLNTGFVRVEDSGRLDLRGGTVQLYHDGGISNLAISSHGELLGYGQVLHMPILSAPEYVFKNDGTISAYRSSILPTLPPPTGTLSFSASEVALARFDLDGDTETGIVNVYRNQTLDINVGLTDSFSGEMNLYHNATLDMYLPWTMHNGVLNVKANSVPENPPLPGIPASTAFISGEQLTQTGGIINIIGDATLQMNARLLMSGGQLVNSGKLIVNGWDMHVQQSATVTLNSATIEAPSSGFHLAGRLNVSAGVDSRIMAGTNYFLEFNSASQVTLNGNLRINSNNAFVYPGAFFTGPGSLYVEPDSNLMIKNGAHVNTKVMNDGRLFVGSLFEVGTSTVKDYWQSDSGVLDVELAGLAPTQSDQLLVNGQALLDGDLELSLRNGFVPSLSDPLISIISATAGISGMFDSVIDPVNMPVGLRYEVIYHPTLVQLQVVSASLIPADFNNDGQLDCLDVNSLVGAIATGSQDLLYDLTSDGQVNGGDLNQWLVDAGAVNLPSGNPYLYGDANLDGAVDGSDFNAWNSHKFTATAEWCSGDFNADGIVDGSDFNAWNSHKFTAADSTSQVPEPTVVVPMMVLLGFASLIRKTRDERFPW